MSTLAILLDDDVLMSTLKKGLYALAACTVVGTAAYIGYRVAESGAKQSLQHRHPELNEQVNERNVVTINDRE
jgi:hypothetical protein